MRLRNTRSIASSKSVKVAEIRFTQLFYLHRIFIQAFRSVKETLRAFWEKIPRAHGGCLGMGSRRRARQAAIGPGEAQTAFDPGIPEWGNPAGVMPCYPHPNRIRCEEATGGTETSKYPEERKSIETPGVAASETGLSPNPRTCKRQGVAARGLLGAPDREPALSGGVRNLDGSGTAWEGRPQRVRAPYANPSRLRGASQSRAGHVKPGPKQGGPPSKAEHSPMTDSEPVP